MFSKEIDETVLEALKRELTRYEEQAKYCRSGLDQPGVDNDEYKRLAIQNDNKAGHLRYAIEFISP